MISNRFVGKALIAAIFAMSAMAHFQDFEGTVAMTKSGFDRVGLDLSVYGVDVALVMPFVAGFAVFLMGAGALALVTGGDNCGSAMLMMFLIPGTFIMHWPMNADGTMDQNQFINFMKNLAILGGLIIVRNSMNMVVKQKTE